MDFQPDQVFEGESRPIDSVSEKSFHGTPDPHRNLEGTSKMPNQRPGLQDRLLTRIIQQVLPIGAEDVVDSEADQPAEQVGRPGFSLPLMTNNFRRFNARIGIVFIVQESLDELFAWKSPTRTLSFLAVYTFLCLDPYLLSVLPLATILLGLMVSTFIARHPPPPMKPSTTLYALDGPPIAPPSNIRPVSEMSKDFFRNMRDIQNSMEDFTRIHDTIVGIVGPWSNFSDEGRSSIVFVLLFALTLILFIASHLLPWNAILLIVGWAGIGSRHPSSKRFLITLGQSQLGNQGRDVLDRFNAMTAREVIMDSTPELREVEIFELHKQTHGDWEPWLFGTSPYDHLCPRRIAGDRPRGTRFFEDVQPPTGWEWADKKWTLDLLSRDWVEERMLTGVEVETEGERWVYDLRVEDHQGFDESNPEPVPRGTARNDWEEGNGDSKKGVWRRRRWVRSVKRRPIKFPPVDQ